MLCQIALIVVLCQTARIIHPTVTECHHLLLRMGFKDYLVQEDRSSIYVIRKGLIITVQTATISDTEPPLPRIECALFGEQWLYFPKVIPERTLSFWSEKPEHRFIWARSHVDGTVQLRSSGWPYGQGINQGSLASRIAMYEGMVADLRKLQRDSRLILDPATEPSHPVNWNLPLDPADTYAMHCVARELGWRCFGGGAGGTNGAYHADYYLSVSGTKFFLSGESGDLSIKHVHRYSPAQARQWAHSKRASIKWGSVLAAPNGELTITDHIGRDRKAGQVRDRVKAFAKHIAELHLQK